jgi:NADH-quinone oxidoreductase subunit J
MIVQALFFYFFAGMCIASAAMVITSRNPVHSVLFLILAFVSAAGLFVLMGAEFLAMILIVVYVGAVAVLFLFVVMMLDVDFAELKQGVLQYLPLGIIIGGIFVGELIFVVFSWATGGSQAITSPIPPIAKVSNTEAIGLVLYTRYVYYFEAAGLILLVAMVGAIVLTLQHRVRVRRQSIAEQVARTPATAIEIRHVRPGQGWGDAA